TLSPRNLAAASKSTDLSRQPITAKPGLHARLALLWNEPNRATELAAYLPACRSDELLTLRQLLKPYAAAVSPALWTVLTDEKAEPGNRVRAAGALTARAPGDARGSTRGPAVAGVGGPGESLHRARSGPTSQPR